MADLDDFFAKRDKKKPKGKKFTTADDASKTLELKAKERKKQESQRSTYVAPNDPSGEPPQALSEYRQQVVEDDEWKEYEEKQPDYAGLKIKELILEDDDDDFGAKDPENREGVEDEANGPWNRQTAKDEPKSEAPTPAETPAETPSEEKEPEIPPEKVSLTPEEEKEDTEKGEEEAEQPKKTGGYVPPHLREGSRPTATATTTESAPSPPTSASSAVKGAYVPPNRRGGGTEASGSSGASKKKKDTTAVPELTNEQLFPTLGS